MKNMIPKIFYIITSYFYGSILFSELNCKLIKSISLFEVSDNHNPGASNAYKYGGVLCCILSVIGDLSKGFIPVYFYQYLFKSQDIGWLLTASVAILGHAYSIYYRFKGGIGITVSFGVLLGLFPQYIPFMLLAVVFVLLLLFTDLSNSIITIFSFSLTSLFCILLGIIKQVELIYILIVIIMTIIVNYKMYMNLTEKERVFLLKKHEIYVKKDDIEHL